MICPLLNSTEFYRCALYLSYSSNTHTHANACHCFACPQNFSPSGQTRPRAVIIQNFLETFTYEPLIATLKVCASGFVVSGSSEIHLKTQLGKQWEREEKTVKIWMWPWTDWNWIFFSERTNERGQTREGLLKLVLMIDYTEKMRVSYPIALEEAQRT